MQSISRLAMFLALMVFSLPAVAEIAIQDAKSYETAQGMKVGAAFMGLRSDRVDRLTAASSPIAGRVEIHSMADTGGVMKMRKIDYLDIPADKTIHLEPSGYHLMLMDLKEPLKTGSEFPLTLKFKEAGEKTITVKILSRGELKKTLDNTMDHHAH